MSLVSPVYNDRAGRRPMERGRKHYLKRRPRLPDHEQGKLWLNVPYEEKDQAKAQGAKWDPLERCWYAPTRNAELKRFGRWIWRPG